MTNKKLCLVITEKITFALAALLFTISSFLPLFSYSNGTSKAGSETFFSVLTVIGYSIIIISFLLGLGVSLFCNKKYYVIGTSLHLASPVTALIILLNYLINATSVSTTTGYNSTSYKISMGSGAILLFISLLFYIISIVIHAISNIPSVTVNDNADLDARVKQIHYYKELKDDGIITEEEYNLKKEEILKLHSSKKDNNTK